ncbi:hypothetical protein YYC_04872 [Plasmodium yoelii 17X]|uniref:YIR protein n=1 Tax=Plasmodium yoelii 17X TaxID=1323249 RepID=V7PDE0_PLAYE|nr:hypothetical protein YYC_04872 [Plasmodium yoelii 17X]
MDSNICENFDLLRKHLPDNLKEKPSAFFEDLQSLNNYCPNKNCNTDLDKIKAGFLWLFDKNCSKSENTYSDEKNINAIFLYIISWLSYKLNQNSDHYFTKIKDFYNAYVNDNEQYNTIIQNANKCPNLKGIIDKKSDFLNINIEYMSNFYDAFKLLCSMHNDKVMNKQGDAVLNNAIMFFNEYTEINDYYNIENTPYSQILSILSTDYNILKSELASRIDSSKQFPILPTGKATKSFLRNSSIKISLIPMVFIFFALLIYLGILYKVNNKSNENASKTQFKNQKNKKENKSLMYDSKSNDYFKNSNNG